MKHRATAYYIAAAVWLASTWVLALSPGAPLTPKAGQWMLGSGLTALAVLAVAEYLSFADYASAWYPDLAGPVRHWRLTALAFSAEGDDDADFVSRKKALKAVLLLWIWAGAILGLLATYGPA